MFALAARGLVVGYDSVPMCSPATFALSAGQPLVLVGANRAGIHVAKHRLRDPLPLPDGEVGLRGEQPDLRHATQCAAVARDLSEESFFPVLSVREHLEFVHLGHRTSTDVLLVT